MAQVDIVLTSGASKSIVSRAIETTFDEVDEERSAAKYFLVIAAGCAPLPGGIDRMLNAAEDFPQDTVLIGTAVPLEADETIDRERVRAYTSRHLTRVGRFSDRSYVAVYGRGEVAAVLCKRSRLETAALERAAAAGPQFVLDTLGRDACVVLADPVCAKPEIMSAPASTRLSRVRDALGRVAAHGRGQRSGARQRINMTSAALGAALGLEDVVNRARMARDRFWERLKWRVLLPLGERAYDYTLSRFPEWPIGRRPAAQVAHGRPSKVAYYIWRFPVLSETFIRREIAALREAGVDVAVVADAPGADVNQDPELAPLVRVTSYVLPVEAVVVMRDTIMSFIRRPLRTLNLAVYTLTRAYNVPKSPGQDARVFLKALRLAAILRSKNVTHLHSPWGDTNAFVGMIAARLVGADFSLQFRAQDLHRRTLSFLVAEKIHNARFVITNTKYNLRYLRELARPRDRAKIRQIYNGLELDRLRGARRTGERREGSMRILSVARLIEPKGLPYLFQSCRELIDRGRDVRCTVVGGAELPLYVNDLVEIRSCRSKLRLDDVVDLAGALPFAQVIEAYRNADIFVLPCVVGADGSNDIIPNVILEAMAMGVPVVATTLTAIPELIEDGETGLLVPPNDTAALTEALERLIADPALREQLARNARARVSERFDVTKNVQDYAELFRST